MYKRNAARINAGEARTLRERLFLTACYATAVTLGWSGVKLGPGNLSDVTLIAACLLGAGLAGRSPRAHGFWYWASAPTAIAAMLLARDGITGVHSINFGTSGIVVGSSLMFLRIAMSTLAAAVFLRQVSLIGGQPLTFRVGACWLAGVSASSVVAVLQANGFARGLPLVEQTLSEFSERYSGLASHPNALAQSAALAVPLAAYYFHTFSGRWRVVVLLGLATLAMGVDASGSRAGVVVGVAVTVMSVIAIGSLPKIRSWTLPFILAATVLAIVYAPSIIANTRLAANDESAAQSNVGRAEAVATGWAHFSQSPFFGTGLGSWYGELSVLVLLAGGGVALLGAYAVFVGGICARFNAHRRDFASAAGVLSFIALLGFALLNNGAFERFTFVAVLCLWALLSQEDTGRPQHDAVRVAAPSHSRYRRQARGHP